MSIKDTLDALAPLRSRLDDQDTKIGSLIGVIEEALRNRVNVRISTDMGDGRTLAFSKSNNKWHLLVESNGASASLLSSPRQLRCDVFALGHVEALIHGALEQIDAMIAARANAIGEAARILAALEVTPSS